MTEKVIKKKRKHVLHGEFNLACKLLNWKTGEEKVYFFNRSIHARGFLNTRLRFNYTCIHKNKLKESKEREELI